MVATWILKKALSKNLFLHRFQWFVLKLHTFFKYPDSLTPWPHWWSDALEATKRGRRWTVLPAVLRPGCAAFLKLFKGIFPCLEITRQQATSKWTASESGELTGNSVGRVPVLSENKFSTSPFCGQEKRQRMPKHIWLNVNGNCVHWHGIISLPSVWWSGPW